MFERAQLILSTLFYIICIFFLSVNIQIQVSQLNLTCVDVKWNRTDNQATNSYEIDISKTFHNKDARSYENGNIKRTNYIVCGLDQNFLLPFNIGTV